MGKQSRRKKERKEERERRDEEHTGGESGERQVPDADVGLTHNVGGIGQYTFVHIFKRD